MKCRVSIQSQRPERSFIWKSLLMITGFIPLFIQVFCEHSYWHCFQYNRKQRTMRSNLFWWTWHSRFQTTDITKAKHPASKSLNTWTAPVSQSVSKQLFPAQVKRSPPALKSWIWGEPKHSIPVVSLSDVSYFICCFGLDILLTKHETVSFSVYILFLCSWT